MEPTIFKPRPNLNRRSNSLNSATAYFIIWFLFNNNFRFSIKWYSRAQKVIKQKYVKYTCSMETVQQNGRFTLFSSKFPTNIYSILYGSRLISHWMLIHDYQQRMRLHTETTVRNLYCLFPHIYIHKSRSINGKILSFFSSQTI